jgi:hypothetical protein
VLPVVLTVNCAAAAVMVELPEPDTLRALLAVSFIYALPDVLTANVGAFVCTYWLNVPMFPEPDDTVNVPAVDMLLADGSVIVPTPLAVKVTFAPVTPAFKIMLPPVEAAACNTTLPPVAVIKLLTVIVPLVAESVKV